MAKKLVVTTPVTVDGVNLKYDDEKQVVYKKTILELGAKKGLESLNSKLPNQLKATFRVIEVADAPTSASNDELKRKLESLEAEKLNNEMIDRISQLEKELAERNEQKASEIKEAEAKGKADGIKEAETKAAAEAKKNVVNTPASGAATTAPKP